MTLVAHGEEMAGKTPGGIGFALNFLWLLSFFQEKESNKDKKKRPVIPDRLKVNS